jgi:hypothetical protein
LHGESATRRTFARPPLRSILAWTAIVALLLAAGVHSMRRHDWYLRQAMIHSGEAQRLTDSFVRMSYLTE